MTGQRIIRQTIRDLPKYQLGIDAGTQEAGQITDWHNDKWSIAINHYGYRMAWLRNVKCPCAPPSAQLVAANPNCPMCKGGGYYYFGQGDRQPLAGEEFTHVQNWILQGNYGTGIPAVIRVLTMGLSIKDADYNTMGSWRAGECFATVQAQNRLAYRDRLIGLDMNIVHTEVVTPAMDPATQRLTLPLRYLVSRNIFTLRTLSASYTAEYDYEIKHGTILFYDGRGPAMTERVAISYETFPIYVVDSMPNAIRTTNELVGVASPTSAEGNLFDLPIRCVIKIENLAGQRNPSE